MYVQISATFACVPAGIYRIVWQLYLTAETAGLRDLILRSTMYQRKDTTHRCQYDYRPTENHLLRLPKGQVVDLAMPQPIMVLPEHEYASVMAEVLSAGFNWKSNVSFVTVRFETIEATL
ncbi:hypothetical protein IWQ60_004396 [Tieghemiomyces parasiticus]|uniref:Uncharacterized protein n=1 Tax=Tieghemiomyces parasiticus TaxID=78921 RepID=A0A9W8A7W5_9FUNG|nr:hypothetical protein IWQ60_004396 [Tieghemiomyces parasiticus]